MKTISLNVLRFAGWAGLALLILAAGMAARAWFNPSGAPQGPASQPIQEIAATPTDLPAEPTAVTPSPTPLTATGTRSAYTPMIIDPSLCEGQSISPYMPGEDIAFDGGRVVINQFTFEFWLTCSNSTQNYTPGTQPIERLGLHAIWTYSEPLEDLLLTDFYGFEPRLYQAMLERLVTDGFTTSSGASGTISVAEAGEQIPEGIFVLPNLTDPARFITRLETARGTWSAAVNFRLEAGPDGYRPVDVRVEALPVIASSEPPKLNKITYPKSAKLDGSGTCPSETIQSISTGTGKFSWPLTADGVDQEFPGITIYSKDPNAPVAAADTGTVVFSGQTSSGESNYVLLIDHGNGFQSLYFHLREILPACGDTVEKGQVIGETWNNVEGDAQSYIHFQIYQQGMPINPLDVLESAP